MSRFIVTIDFPAQKLYLRKGKQFERPDRPDASGLHILRKGEAAVVHSVDPESPGASAGIRAGDVLLQAGTLRAGEATLFQLRAALREPGTVPCVIRRDKTDLRVTLTIPDWSKTPFGAKPQ